MIKDFKQQTYLKYLIHFSKKLHKYKPIIFYGTLLGITRENHIIKNDDDIDFLVDLKFKKKIISNIIKNKKFKLNIKASDNFFSQVYFEINNIVFYIDFYFYTNDKKKNYIIDRHNFSGNIFDSNNFLHIPKKFLFPLKKSNEYKNVYLPYKNKDLCKFLYGENWSKPLKKKYRL